MRLFFSVGEPSGDLHAAKLIEQLGRHTQVECVGYGGPQMAAAGFRVDFALTNLAVMGLGAVLPHLREFRRLVLEAGAQFDRERPDAVILVDFPGFNWWIAREAKKRKIPVVYFCPPQLWAWATWRVRKARKLTDLVLTSLPFEDAWYRKRGVKTQYVGHPFFDDICGKELNEPFLRRVTQDRQPNERLVAILPGSRNHEIRWNFPLQVRVMKKLQRRVPGCRFLIACYNEAQKLVCEKLLSRRGVANVELYTGHTSEIIEAADVALMVSGSVSLEVMVRETPAVVVYALSLPMFVLKTILLVAKHISLPNLIAGRRLMPEFIPVGFKGRQVDRMTDQLAQWLSKPNEHSQRVADLSDLSDQVAQPGAIARAAEAILKLLGQNISEPPVRKAA